jgi:parvulin-like peptidyl-prolyl isomerase
MRESCSHARRGRALIASVPAAFAAILGASFLASAQPPPGQQPDPWGQPQPQQQPPANPWGLPTPATAPAQRPPQQQQQAPAPAGSPVIARIDGRNITEMDFDRIALPYFQRLKAQFGGGFDGEIKRIATFNVLDELIRRELLTIESQRQKIEVSQAEIDALLMQDPFFRTNGTFDAAKLASYKTNPGSNYLQMLPHLREMAAVKKLDESLARRFMPTPAQVRAEWAKRNDQVRIQVLPLMARDMSIEPEATEAERERYYQAHPDQFMRKTRVRLRYARLPLPAESDSVRAAEESRALDRAKAIADSLRRGTLPDTAAELTDSGLFDVPASTIPGLGRVAGLTDSIGRIDEDSTIRIVGPYATPDAVIVGVIAERQPKRVAPMREVLGDVKRHADAEKRRAAGEAERRAFYETHRERWRGPRASLTRVTLNPATIAVNAPSPQEVDRWYARHARSLFGMSDSSKAWLPPIDDSLRAVVRSRLVEEQRSQRMPEVMDRIVKALRTRDTRALARVSGATAEKLTLIKDSTADTLFDLPFVDSLLASAAAVQGTVQGPRAFGSYWTVWRIDALDTTFVPPYEAVRARSDEEFVEDRRRKDEVEGRSHFEQHRAEYKTPLKYALDYVAVRILPPDSVHVPGAEVRRQYDANPKSYRQEEQVRARHILFTTRDAGPGVEKQAKTRADSLLAVIRKEGGDFAELAKRFSQEPGAATSGGDLGWFGRGRMVKEFEAAAFALQPGEISAVVRTQFGYHIIKLEGRKAEGLRPFDEVSGEIRRQMAQSRGDSTARRSATRLRRRLALGGDAKLLAAPHGGVVSAAPIAATEAVPAIGFAQGLAQDLPGMAPGKWAPDIYRAGNSYLVLQVRQKMPPRPAEFDEVKNQAVEDMRSAKRRALLNQKVEAIRAGLAAGASLDSLAAPYGGLKDTGLLGRMAAFVPMVGSEPRAMEKAFAMKPGQVSDTLQVAQGVVWMRLEEKKSGDPATFKAVSAQIESELTKKKYDEWMEARKKTVKIEILRADLKGPRSSPSGPVTLSKGG